MATDRGGPGVAPRRHRARGLWWASVLLLGGCVDAQSVSVPDAHPANPRAAAGSLTASLALASYQSPADFAARRPDAGTPPIAGAGGAPGAAEPAVQGQAAVHGQAQVAQAAGPKPSGVGTINTVHADRRTVNISHEPIPSVGFPAMTMDLRVTPSVDLGAVRPGSRVTFTLTRGPDGVYLIDSIKPSSDSGTSGSSTPAGGGMPGHGSMPGMDHGTMPTPGGPPPAKGSSP